jgi:hypothetical protein
MHNLLEYARYYTQWTILLASGVYSVRCMIVWANIHNMDAEDNFYNADT